MSFILRSHRDRYRKKARENFYRNCAIAAFFIMTLAIGYVAGQKKYTQDMRQMTQRSRELDDQNAKAEQNAIDMQARLQTLSVQYAQLQAKYTQDVPQGDLGLLTSLVKEQMAKGMAVERMAQIIRAAQPPQNCTPSVNKRVIVSTPFYKGPSSAVTFADGLISVVSRGEPSINNKQEKEAWYDPGKPVTVTYNIVGGNKEDKTGLLPLHHAIILKGKEYRFTVSEGPRSFIMVTSDSCDAPDTSGLPTRAYSISATDNSM